jgi:hypothetical protein
MTTTRYMQVTERLRDARRRGLDVDHYLAELRGIWSAMDTAERKQLRERLIEIEQDGIERSRVKRAAA